MIVGGDWLLHMCGEPVRDGAVLVSGDRIARVGTYAGLTAAFPDEPAENHRGCVVMPGLVNAHTHLSLTVLREVVVPDQLAEWLKGVTRAIGAMSDADFGASAALGALESLESGVTVVGDIAYGFEAPEACLAAGVAGAFYWEVLGIDAEELTGELARRHFSGRGRLPSSRMRAGISPHSPYTSGPALLQAAAERSRALDVGLAIHVAESRDERRLLADGTGPFAATAAQLARGFAVPHSSSVAYLERLGVLDGALAIHCVHLDGADCDTLARRASGVALCPRSNSLLGNGTAPVGDLLRAGAVLACGTDSAASNEDLDMLSEARALGRIEPRLGASRLLQIVTSEGARALQMDDRLGSLSPGRQADLAVFRVEAGHDPEAAVLERGGHRTLAAVMSAGTWRIRDGRPTAPVDGVRRAADRARAVALRAVEAS